MSAPETPHEPPRSSSLARPEAGPQRHHTTKRRTLGDWDLLKTVGAGSMGKVKLARHRITGELAAVKIIPRYGGRERDARDKGSSSESQHDGASPGKHQNKSTSAESKEIRTIREGAIVSLLHHRYICGMKEVMVMQHHYYLVFEYVNGGQMLDYIISHGRLKEKQARKFARQIASALDYCHHNSVVHRDLKIENILISKSGDIQIIDFGLSNLFSPRSLLKTFCGSLYFAAPELLNARQYVGPEVDIWSFGIVLYVLACGKVPFDDQSMPALHAKIKRGHVDYPNWLSVECKNLLSRMLVVDPKARATLAEIINHPWMLKGCDGPQDSYIPYRRPLTLPLDPEVLRGMQGFEFGPEATIEADLTAIVESAEYQAASTAWYRLNNSTHFTNTPISPTSGSSGLLSPLLSFEHNSALDGPKHKKPGSAFSFDFYKRKSASSSGSHLPPNAGDVYLSNHTPDPTNAYHPLVSIYYLVREKQERARRRPVSLLTSSPSMVIHGNPSVVSAMKKSQSHNGEMVVPVIPVPETAHTHTSSLDAAAAVGGSAAIPVPVAHTRSLFPGRSRSVNHGHSGYIPPTPPSPHKGRYLPPTEEHAPAPALSPTASPSDHSLTSPGGARLPHGPPAASPPLLAPHPMPKKEFSVGGILRRISTRKGSSRRKDRAADQPPPPAVPTGADGLPPQHFDDYTAADDAADAPATAGSTPSEDDELVPTPSPSAVPPLPADAPSPDLTDLPPPPPPPKESSSKGMIRFERLFSRASNLGRSTSISEGTYNRRVSRGLS
ncbi:kinase-like domain-containing protein [Dipodascopsis tothii]|uniref:kinase-like domain-containing protein n=1 Tax=Dipodascopsis tothii TaxID=44089 RepID=UPI0034CF7440